MKKRPVSVVIAVILVVWLPAAILLYGWHGRRALRGYVAQLRAKGEKVTFQQLEATLSPPGNDSLSILTNLVQKLGPLPGTATNLDAMHFIGLGRAQVAWRLSNPPLAGGETAITWDDLSNQLAAVAAPLADLRRAMEQPSPNLGVRTDYFETPRTYPPTRNATAWLACAALVDLHYHEAGPAVEDIQAVAGLANLHREEYVLSIQMTRIAAGLAGLGLTWEALQASGWDDQQLAALQQCWERVDLLEALERGMEGERCAGLEVLRRLRNSGWQLERTPGAPTASSKLGVQRLPGAKRAGRFYLRTTVPNDVLLALRHQQAQVEYARLLATNRPWKEVKNSVQQRQAELERLATSPRRVLYLFTLLGTVHTAPAFRVAVRAETQRRLAITAVALKRYELKHARAAPDLAALVPEFLPAVPRDCMSGQPLRYRANADGTFTLYSVGEDGEDNGGDPTTVKPDAKPGLWEGRDAVWPSPSSDDLPQTPAPAGSATPEKP